MSRQLSRETRHMKSMKSIIASRPLSLRAAEGMTGDTHGNPPVVKGQGAEAARRKPAPLKIILDEIPALDNIPIHPLLR
jgi:hypothetical protein